jgi:hypothetical protein
MSTYLLSLKKNEDLIINKSNRQRNKKKIFFFQINKNIIFFFAFNIK